MPQTAQKKASKTAAPAQPVPEPKPTETADHEYALVSVLYHALQGAQACQQYVQDAEKAGDAELVSFFQDCVQEQQDRAKRAKQFVVSRVDVGDEEDEDDDDDDDEDEDEDEDDEQDSKP